MMFRTRRNKLALVGVAAAAALFMTSCAGADEPAPPPSGGTETPADEFGISDDGYTLEALIEAAKKEEGINVFDSTGKIVEIAENFSKKYGVSATGVKMKANDQIETAIREAAAKNIQSDVFLITDVPTISAELLELGVVTSWFPPDMADAVPEEFRSPAQITTNPNVWAYNTEVYGDVCPVDNIWQLTTPDYKGKVVFYDVALKPSYMDWFNGMALDFDDEMRALYEKQFGEKLATDEATAAHEWVKRLIANGLRQTKGDEDIADAVGAPGQKDPSFGMLSAAKFRDNAEKDYVLGLCKEMEPWVGQAYTKAGVIATGTQSPNLSKLFIHYLYTDEGIASQVMDGKPSTNVNIELPADEPSGVGNYWDRVFVSDSKNGLRDYEDRADWSDFWTMNQ